MSKLESVHTESKIEMTQSEIYNIVFALLRSALWGEEAFPFTSEQEIDWTAVNKELSIQTVQILPVDILVKADPAHSQLYLQNTAKSIRSWYHLMQEQQNLYQTFKKAGIPFTVLKGAGADFYYPQPSYRRMGDIDFIVRPGDFDKAVQLMADNGYNALDMNDSRHKEYTKNGVLVEMHRFFSVLADSEAGKWLDQRILDSLDSIPEQSIDGFVFPMLPTLENGLVLLCHINQHMENGLGLRQITDWMLYVKKELNDDYWNSTFADAAEKIGLKTLAITVTKMCQMYLGLGKDITWCQNANPDLCERLMEYIMDQGNFGRKRSHGSNTAMNTFAIRNVKVLFNMLQQRGLVNFKACHKYSFLRPFAWIYQTFRYIHLALIREQPLKQLKEEYSQSSARDELLNGLGVVRRAKGFTAPDGTHFQ